MAEKLRTDERLVVMERTNLRHLQRQHLPERPALATLDLSFISLLKVPCQPQGLLKGCFVCHGFRQAHSIRSTVHL